MWLEVFKLLGTNSIKNNSAREGHELISSHENTKIRTVKQPLTKKKKNTETYQKRYPTSKDKEETTRQSEGAMAIKSNPIPPLQEWATHKRENNHITEVLPQE